MFRFLKSLVNSEVLGEEIILTNQRIHKKNRDMSPGDDPHLLLSKTYMSRMKARGQDISLPESGLKAFSETLLFSCLPEGQDIRALALKILFEERPDIEQRFPKFKQDFEMIMGPFFKKIENGQNLKELYFKNNSHGQVEHLFPMLMISLSELSSQLALSQSETPSETRINIPGVTKCKSCGQSINGEWLTCPICHAWLAEGD